MLLDQEKSRAALLAKLEARKKKKIADEKARLEKEAVQLAEEERRRELMAGLHREAEEKKAAPVRPETAASTSRPISRGIGTPATPQVRINK